MVTSKDFVLQPWMYMINASKGKNISSQGCWAFQRPAVSSISELGTTEYLGKSFCFHSQHHFSHFLSLHIYLTNLSIWYRQGETLKLWLAHRSKNPAIQDQAPESLGYQMDVKWKGRRELCTSWTWPAGFLQCFSLSVQITKKRPNSLHREV